MGSRRFHDQEWATVATLRCDYSHAVIFIRGLTG
jgi:hypothetical protein